MFKETQMACSLIMKYLFVFYKKTFNLYIQKKKKEKKEEEERF
jgi:hypothetical protein